MQHGRYADWALNGSDRQLFHINRVQLHTLYGHNKYDKPASAAMSMLFFSSSGLLACLP